MIRTVLVIAVAAHVVLLAVMMWGGTDPYGPRAKVARGADFLHCWAGGAILADPDQGPEQLYDPGAFRRAQREQVRIRRPYPVAYPPPLYQGCAALVPLGYSHAARLWSAAMPAMWGLGLVLIIACFPALGVRARTTALLIGLISPTLFMNTATGQAAGLWLLLLGAGLMLWKRGRPILAGVVLGLICAKPGVAAPLALALAVTRQGRTFGGFVAGGALLVAASAALDGTGIWFDWVELIRDGGLSKMMVVPHRHHTLAALLSYPVRDTELGPWLKQLGPWLGLGLVIWTARRAGRLDPVGDDDATLRFGAVLSMALLASPHLVGYDTGAHAPAFLGAALLLHRGAVRRPRWGLAVLVLAFFGPVMFPLGWELKFSFGALFLLLWSAWLTTEMPQPLHCAAETDP